MPSTSCPMCSICPDNRYATRNIRPSHTRCTITPGTTVAPVLPLPPYIKVALCCTTIVPAKRRTPNVPVTNVLNINLYLTPSPATVLCLASGATFCYVAGCKIGFYKASTVAPPSTLPDVVQENFTPMN